MEMQTAKCRLRELCKQVVWSFRQINFKGKSNINGEFAVCELIKPTEKRKGNNWGSYSTGEFLIT